MSAEEKTCAPKKTSPEVVSKPSSRKTSVPRGKSSQISRWAKGHTGPDYYGTWATSCHHTFLLTLYKKCHQNVHWFIHAFIQHIHFENKICARPAHAYTRNTLLNQQSAHARIPTILRLHRFLKVSTSDKKSHRNHLESKDKVEAV